jgi:hypothetical protein
VVFGIASVLFPETRYFAGFLCIVFKLLAFSVCVYFAVLLQANSDGMTGDQPRDAGWKASDIIFTIHTLPHPIFKRSVCTMLLTIS